MAVALGRWRRDYGFATAGASRLAARSALEQQPAVTPVSFNREILPILSNNCFACHGPDEDQRETKFRFDTQEGAFRKKGVIVPGDAAGSLLVERIANPDPDERMPPAESGHTLTAKQIELLRRWIDEGRSGTRTGPSSPPKRTEPPVIGSREARWVRKPIDRFILARLERKGSKPSPEADKATLLRRVTLDLTGLPPTPGRGRRVPRRQVAGRLREAWSTGCSRRRTTASGWRMQWLDAARYADTHGYHIDSHRDMWRWRDWVIDAFNRNMPFDQFTIEQLAGDLLPNATLEQQIATGLQPQPHDQLRRRARSPRSTTSSYVVDRVDTTATVWLGLTMRLRAVPRPQVRPDHAEGVLSVLRVLQQRAGEGLDGTQRQRAAADQGCRTRTSRRGSKRSTAAIEAEKPR